MLVFSPALCRREQPAPHQSRPDTPEVPPAWEGTSQGFPPGFMAGWQSEAGTSSSWTSPGLWPVGLRMQLHAAAPGELAECRGAANLRQTSEEAISKTAITGKGNKLLVTSKTFTHGGSGPREVIRAMCLQNCIIYIEILHRGRSGAEIEG